MPGTAIASSTKSKRQKGEAKEYLKNIDPAGVEKVHGVGMYKSWHSDRKSQSTTMTNITFQTKSIQQSGGTVKYITIVAKKGQSDAFVTYESDQWETETAEEIITTMIAAL